MSNERHTQGANYVQRSFLSGVRHVYHSMKAILFFTEAYYSRMIICHFTPTSLEDIDPAFVSSQLNNFPKLGIVDLVISKRKGGFAAEVCSLSSAEGNRGI
jgi:hypothetical protein